MRRAALMVGLGSWLVAMAAPAATVCTLHGQLTAAARTLPGGGQALTVAVSSVQPRNKADPCPFGPGDTLDLQVAPGNAPKTLTRGRQVTVLYQKRLEWSAVGRQRSVETWRFPQPVATRTADTTPAAAQPSLQPVKLPAPIGKVIKLPF